MKKSLVLLAILSSISSGIFAQTDTGNHTRDTLIRKPQPDTLMRPGRDKTYDRKKNRDSLNMQKNVPQKNKMGAAVLRKEEDVAALPADQSFKTSGL